MTRHRRSRKPRIPDNVGVPMTRNATSLPNAYTSCSVANEQSIPLENCSAILALRKCQVRPSRVDCATHLLDPNIKTIAKSFIGRLGTDPSRAMTESPVLLRTQTLIVNVTSEVKNRLCGVGTVVVAAGTSISPVVILSNVMLVAKRFANEPSIGAVAKRLKRQIAKLRVRFGRHHAEERTMKRRVSPRLSKG